MFKGIEERNLLPPGLSRPEQQLEATYRNATITSSSDSGSPFGLAPSEATIDLLQLFHYDFDRQQSKGGFEPLYATENARLLPTHTNTPPAQIRCAIRTAVGS